MLAEFCGMSTDCIMELRRVYLERGGSYPITEESIRKVFPETKIKNCPHCNCKIQYSTDEGNTHTFECGNCGYECKFILNNFVEVIEIWNRRLS